MIRWCGRRAGGQGGWPCSRRRAWRTGVPPVTPGALRTCPPSGGEPVKSWGTGATHRRAAHRCRVGWAGSARSPATCSRWGIALALGFSAAGLLAT